MSMQATMGGNPEYIIFLCSINGALGKLSKQLKSNKLEYFHAQQENLKNLQAANGNSALFLKFQGSPAPESV